MSWQIVLSSVDFYIKAGFLSFLFGLPLLLYFAKNRKPVDLFLVFIFGVLNLFSGVFVYANFNYFWGIRELGIDVFVFGFVLIELLVVLYKVRGKLFKLELKNQKYFLVVFLVGMGMFCYLQGNYWDLEKNKYFSPGYGINHDYILLLGVIKSFISFGEESSVAVKSYFNLQKTSGYPEGGTYISVLFSKLFNVDPYFVYQSMLSWFCLLNLYVINYFVIAYFKKINLISRITLLVMAVLSVFNFLSLSLINSSVLGSSITIPFILFAMLWTLVYLNRREKDPLFYLILLMSLTVVVFIYSYFSMVYYFLLLAILPFVYGLKLIKWTFLVKIFIVVLVSFLLPFNFVKTKTLLKVQLTSENKEVNIFKGGTYGNTIGFVNPLITFSVWNSNPDYRFFAVNHYNLWLFFSLITPLLLLSIMQNKKRRMRNLILVISVPFLIFTAVTFWVTKSPYQNVKALQTMANVWPLILFLFLFDNLKNKKWGLKLVTFVCIGIYSYYAFKGAVFAFTYIGKPIVESNYELMEIGDEFCQSEGNKLFLGRDEMSTYFLIECDDIFYYYDRAANNAGFWEVIALNEMPSLDAKCEANSLELTKIDYSEYDDVLVDKCFKFENDDYKMAKEFEVYRWYKRNK